MSLPTTKTFRGTSVPTLGIGTWEVTGDDARDAVADALAAGYRHVDTAVGYANHREVGEGLRRSGLARDEYWLTTKIPPDDFAPAALRASAVRSLADLGVDHVDLLLLHWPVGGDEVVVEALGELQGLRTDGLIRELGVSNVPAGMLKRLLGAVPEIFADQVEFHAQLEQDRLLAVAAENDLMVTAYSPLANGKGLIEQETLQDIAAARGASPAQVAIAWLARKPGVTVLPRSTNPDRRRENLAALEVDLTDEDVARLDELSTSRKRYIDPPFAPDWQD
jgi:2,5-diketo-D-gluconate reductase B